MALWLVLWVRKTGLFPSKNRTESGKPDFEKTGLSSITSIFKGEPVTAGSCHYNITRFRAAFGGLCSPFGVKVT